MRKLVTRREKRAALRAKVVDSVHWAVYLRSRKYRKALRNHERVKSPRQIVTDAIVGGIPFVTLLAVDDSTLLVNGEPVERYAR